MELYDGKIQVKHYPVKSEKGKYGMFSPSQELVDLVKKCTNYPGLIERISLELHDRYMRRFRPKRDKKTEIKENVSRRIEGILDTIAIEKEGEYKIITENNRFTRNIYDRLVKKLVLDPNKAEKVSEKIYQELLAYIPHNNCQRIWGEIVAEGSTIKLKYDKKRYLTINVD